MKSLIALLGLMIVGCEAEKKKENPIGCCCLTDSSLGLLDSSMKNQQVGKKIKKDDLNERKFIGNLALSEENQSTKSNIIIEIFDEYREKLSLEELARLMPDDTNMEDSYESDWTDQTYDGTVSDGCRNYEGMRTIAVPERKRPEEVKAPLALTIDYSTESELSEIPFLILVHDYLFEIYYSLYVRIGVDQDQDGQLNIKEASTGEIELTRSKSDKSSLGTYKIDSYKNESSGLENQIDSDSNDKSSHETEPETEANLGVE